MNVIFYLILLFIELIVLFGVSVYGVGLLFSALNGAPYVPTSKKKLNTILENAHLNKGAQFVELGSGDGRLLRYAVKQFGVNGVGIEVNPLLVWLSRLLSKRDGTSKQIHFIRKNIFHYSLAQADFLYIFLMPTLIVQLLPKFKKELKKGAVIISHGFKIIGYEKHLIHTEFDKAFSTYYYKV